MKLSIVWVVSLIFMMLKLTHYVTWSWWVVFAPVLISVALTVAFFGAALAIAMKKR